MPPRAWFECLSEILLSLGFKCSKADASLFTIQKPKSSLKKNPTVIQDIISTLGSEFARKNLGNYNRDLLAKAKMESYTVISMPMVVNEIISLTDREPVNQMEYRAFIGSVQYLTISRPDITHSELCLSTFPRPYQGLISGLLSKSSAISKALYFGLRYLSQSCNHLYALANSD